MGYSEKDGQVVLTMSREDYERVLIMLGIASGVLDIRHGDLKACLELMNRINEGNPHYTPYQVPPETVCICTLSGEKK
jgi:hypothetical protein